VYDLFRDRLIIPITDMHGKVIAFAGRNLREDDERTPKYINSCANPLYDKKEVVYGIDQAFKPARDAKELFIGEGYFDVIQANKQGIENIVATGGTSLTPDHIKIFQSTFRGCDINLVFDGDNAGKEAAIRAGIKIIGSTPSYICLLPDGKDPADIVESGENLREYLAKEDRKSLAEFYIEKRIEDGDISNITGRWKVLRVIEKEALPYLPDKERLLFISELSKSLGLDFNAVSSSISSKSTSQKNLEKLEDKLLCQVYHTHEKSRRILRQNLHSSFVSSPEKKAFLNYCLNNGQDFLSDGDLFDDAEDFTREVYRYSLSEGIVVDEKRLRGTVSSVFKIADELKISESIVDVEDVSMTMGEIKVRRLSLEELFDDAKNSGVKGTILLHQVDRLPMILRGSK